MASPRSTASRSPEQRRNKSSFTTWATFLIGGPLAAGVVSLFTVGPLQGSELDRYVRHRVQWAEIFLFCCALSALGIKMVRWIGERLALHATVLPPWDGKPLPVPEAGPLLKNLDRLPGAYQSSFLGKRIRAVLDFLQSRGSASDLDDHLRTLADNDALAFEGSYALLRLITWAIPILGFLGTVLGITGAISGITPDQLEKGLGPVTDGLAEAFDSTALALSLTMVVMFFTFLVERAEQSILDTVDAFTDRELAHRFERAGTEGDRFLEVMRINTQTLLQATEHLVQRQTELWGKALEAVDLRRADAEKRQLERTSVGMEKALERTLQTHAQRLAELEKQAVERSSNLLQQLTTVAQTVRDTGREQQAGLVRVAEAVLTQAKVLARLQEGEKQLLRTQELMQQNLAALASSGAFERAVHSLTAAVHFLTARSAGVDQPFGNPRSPHPREPERPGAAA